MYRLVVCCAVLLFVLGMAGANAGESKRNKAVSLQTESGLRFNLLEPRAKGPAPTLIVLCGTGANALENDYYLQCGNQLREQGWLCVSVDLPAHGAEQLPNEPEGLKGWAWRVKAGQLFVQDFNARLSAVLDYLIAQKYTDPNRVAVCGTSRGGFLAMHWMSADARVKCAAAFCPVVDLAVLSEFVDQKQSAAVEKLSLIKQKDKLAGKPIWIVIGDQDLRVDTDSVVRFAREIQKHSGQASRLDLHVLPEPRGHTTPECAPAMAACWITSIISNSNAP